MTLEELVDHCIGECGCAEMAELEHVDAACRECIRKIIVKAKADETRRCAQFVGGRYGQGYLGNEILRSGGLEVEDSNSEGESQ